MAWLSRLFGGKSGAAEAVPAEEYKGFRIYPVLMPERRNFRVAARIEKDVDGETKVHNLIRADTISEEEDVIAASIAKSRQMIDEQGEGMFR